MNVARIYALLERTPPENVTVMSLTNEEVATKTKTKSAGRTM